MTFKKLIGKIHLWLGLISGLIVFIVSLTGAILVFEHEIESFFPELPVDESRLVDVQDKPLMSPSALSAVLREKYPTITSWGVSYHTGRAALVFGGLNGMVGEQTDILVNPYTGDEVVPDGSDEEMVRGVDHFFEFMLDGHVALWLPPDTGKPVVGYVTLVFFIMLITGIVLWWPKNKAARKQRFKFKWKPMTKWRRKNYDLHNVLGFYMSWIAFFIAITGLVMAFDWFSYGWYYVLSGGGERGFEKPAVYTPIAGDPLDILWSRVYDEYPDYEGWLEFYYPESPDEAIFFRCDPVPGQRQEGQLTFNPYTLEPIGKGSSLAFAVTESNYAIHVGEIGGLPTKLLAFFASLIAASLPISGFVIWWGRRKKGKKTTVRKLSH